MNKDSLTLTDHVITVRVNDMIIKEILYSYVLSDEAKHYCASYFLLHWSGERLCERLMNHGNTVSKDGTLYYVQWNSAEQKENAKKAERVAMSFRRLKNAQLGYVIPKIIYGDRRPLDSGRG